MITSSYYIYGWCYIYGWYRVNFDLAYRDYVFTSKRLIKLPRRKGCLGYPRPDPRLDSRPYNWGLILHFKFQFSKSIKSSIFHIFLILTYPLRKISLSQNAQKFTQNRQTTKENTELIKLLHITLIIKILTYKTKVIYKLCHLFTRAQMR